MIPHTGPIAGVAITPEGNIWTAAYEPRAILWGVRDAVVPLSHHTVATKNVNCAAASNCGSWLATGASDGTATLVQRGSGAQASLDHPGDVESIAFSDDGERLASGGTDGMVRVFATEDGALLGVLPHGSTVGAIRYLSSGTLLTVCNDGMLRAWSPDLALVWWVQLSALPLKSLAVVGKTAFVGGHDTLIHAVNLVNQSTEIVFQLATTPKALAARGTRLVLAAYDGTVRVAELAEWTGGELPFTTIAVDTRVWAHGVDVRGDLIASGSFDGVPLVWRYGPDGWSRVSSEAAPVPCISSAALCGEKLVTGGDSGVLWVGAEVLASLGEAITSVRSTANAVMATTWSGNLHVVDPAGHRAHPVADGPVVCGDVEDGQFFAGLYTGGVACLQLSTGKEVWRCEEATGAIKSVHASGELLAVVGRYDPLRIVDVASGSVVARLPLLTSVSDAVRFDPRGGMLACAAGDGEVWFVRVDRGAEVRLEVVARSGGHSRPIKALAWVAPGVVLAGDYAGCIVRHTLGGQSQLVGTASSLLGVSSLTVRGAEVVVTTFDGHITTLSLGSIS